MTVKQTRITTNRFRVVLSRLARSMADLVSKMAAFGQFFKTIVGLSSARFQSTLFFLHNN